jgi:hypothetical protein
LAVAITLKWEKSSMLEFYMLDIVLTSDYRLFAGGQWINDTRKPCNSCGVLDEVLEPSNIEIALNHTGRRGFVEHLWNSHSLHIFRQDLINVWVNNGLAGFEVKPVSIVGWFGKSTRELPQPIPSYARLVTRSKVRLLEPPPRSATCPECGFTEYAFPKIGVHLPNGIRLDDTSWDGSDIFGVKNYEFVFFSRRAADLTLRSGLSQAISFVRLENWGRWQEFDIHKWNGKEYKKYLSGFLIRKPEDL